MALDLLAALNDIKAELTTAQANFAAVLADRDKLRAALATVTAERDQLKAEIADPNLGAALDQLRSLAAFPIPDEPTPPTPATS